MPGETARKDPLNDTTLTKLCRAAGADDVGFIDLDRDALAGQRESVLRYLPWVRSLVIVVRSLDRPTVRARLRSLSSAEFVAVGREVEAIIDRVVKDLAGDGVRALGFYCFPAEFGGQDGSPSAVSLRLLAEAAGLGVIGKNRLVLHPRFGADIYLGAIALDRLSFTHKVSTNGGPQFDISETGQASPHDQVAGWRIGSTSEITPELCDLG